MPNNYRIELAAALGMAYERLADVGGWRKVAAQYFKNNIPAGTLNRICKSKGKYLPTNPDYLELLQVPYGLWPISALVKKQIITKKSLHNKDAQNRPKTIQQMSKNELLHALHNRTPM